MSERDPFLDPPPQKRSTGRTILKFFLIALGVVALLFLAFVGLILFMCSKH